MGKLERFTERYQDRGPTVYRAGEGDALTLARLVVEGVVDSGMAPGASNQKKAQIAARAYREIETAMGCGESAFVSLLAYRDDSLAGMVFVRAAGVDLWDGKMVAAVSCLYVLPRFRGDPSCALGLMRAAKEAAEDMGAQRIRVVVSSEDMRAMRRYGHANV